MKTIEEILKQEPIFMHDWSDPFKVVADFTGVSLDKDEYESESAPFNEEYWLELKGKMKEKLKDFKNIKILFASYGSDNYTGNAWVLYEENGLLFEVNGSHCSCYGLEGQWQPEEVILSEIKNRLEKGTFGEDDYSGNIFKKELCKFLSVKFIENRD